MGLGVALTALLAGTQWLVPPAPSVARLPVSSSGDTGPGPNRTLSLLSNRLTLRPHELPVLGDPDAERVLVALLDFCCPHCRATHAVLGPLVEQSSGRLALVVLPAPLSAECNPAIDETEPRFAEACELARLALAVWRAAPQDFPEFERWLFEPELPRTAAAARSRARELIGGSELDAALKDDWIAEQLRANTAAYADSGSRHLPILLSPGMAPIVGRASDDAALRELLERELKLTAP